MPSQPLPDKPPFRSRPLRAFPFFAPRRRGAQLALAVLAALLLARSGFIATARHASYTAEAERNPMTLRRLSAPRGQIYDADGNALTENRRCYSIECTVRQKLTNPSESDVDEILSPLRELPRLRPLITPDLEERTRQNLQRRTRFRLLSGLPQADIIPMLERPEAYPNLTAVPDFQRVYSAGLPLGLISGFTGPIPAEAAGSYPAPRYEPDDEVGRAGIESQFEDVLAGTPGVEERRQDARGRPLAPPSIKQPARPGGDVHLTLRATWQAEAYRLLAERKGSIVVVDLPEGAIRVLASYPSYDPARPAAASVPEGRETSHFNRALRGLYPPGSTFKPFVILGAANGGWDLATTMTCTGSVQIGGWARPFHCNVRSGHGPMDATRALAVSCNSYFYRIAADRGMEDVIALAREFGLGVPTGIELKGEAVGQLTTKGRPNPGEELNLSIGQGTMLCTVLQVARAYAGIALGKDVPPLHIVDRIVAADGSVTQPPPRATALHPTWRPEARRVVLEGLARAVADPRGTASRAGFDPDWQVSGKTGTAEKTAGAQDAWFAGFYPRRDPRRVVVVHIEESEGHGGEEAAPVAAELIRFMESPAEVESGPGPAVP